MQRLIDRLNIKHYDRNFPVVTIRNGRHRETHPPTHRIRIPPNTQSIIYQQKVGPNWQNVFGVAAITLANVTAFVNFIRNNSFVGAHRNVLTNNASWRAFHQVVPRVLTYLDRAGAAAAPAVNPETVPCVDCNLVLPLRNITIDHQRPQAGNDLEPVCKVFRSLGLTVDAPMGLKGNHYLAAHRATVGGLVGAGLGTLNASYTLNDVGKIYYSLADWSGVLADATLERECMDHMVNLRPLCGACNTPNRNVRHF